MKRVALAFFLAGFLIVATAPFQVASAAILPSAPPAPDGLPTVESCVAIALPVVPNLPGTCTVKDAEGNKSAGISNDPKTGGAIINYLRQWLFLLNLAVPSVILLMIIVSGIQYITSGANPSAVKGAKTRLINSIIALVLYLLMFAILQFLVPGGVL